MINNENYYRALNVMDRMEELRLERNIPKPKIGKSLGHSGAYYQAFYDGCRVLKVSTLLKFAKALDISVEYLLTGKNKQPYKDVELNINKISQLKKYKLCNNLQVIQSRLKRNLRNDISIKTLFEFETNLNINITELFKGKYE